MRYHTTSMARLDGEEARPPQPRLGIAQKPSLC